MELAARIRALVAERTGAPVEVGAVAPLAGGACQDLFGVDVQIDGEPERLVLRSDAVRGLPGSIGRAEEFAVIGAAVRAGVPTPRARWLAQDLVRGGAWAYFLDRVDGVTLGGKVARSPALADARRALPRQLGAAAAAVHRVTPSTDPDLPLAQDVLADPIETGLARLRESLDGLSPEPALEYALAWLTRSRPEPGEVTLVHGDFRTGNFVVGERGLVGILDWEFAHWGDPIEDLGWMCVRDWRFGAIDQPAGGITSRRALCDAYTEASGRVVDPARLHWWEVFGNVGWAAGARWQTKRYLSGEQDLELLVIGRRATEMAWEALRLVEVGPDRTIAGVLMFDRPDPATLLFGLAAFLEHDLRPSVADPGLAFRVRIAAHVAQTLALQDGVHDDALRATLASGRALLGDPEAAPPGTRPELVAAVADVEKRVADAIRATGVAGGQALPEPATLAWLRDALAAELRVTNPAFDLRLDL